MGIRNWELWKLHFFRNARQLFSARQRLIPCVFISETGVVSMVQLVLATGYCTSEADKISFAVVNRAKMKMQGYDEMVLPITERSYKPLDPLGKWGETRDKLASLDDVAGTKYNEAFTQVAELNKSSQNVHLMKTLLIVAGIITISIVFAVLIKH